MSSNQPRRAVSTKYPSTARPSAARRGSSESARTAPAGPPVARLERYAAHIPIRDQEADIGYGPMPQLTPSRQSMTSVDSFATAATGEERYDGSSRSPPGISRLSYTSEGLRMKFNVGYNGGRRQVLRWRESTNERVRADEPSPPLSS